MPLKKNPLKLNKLQLRTLALTQVLAQQAELAIKDESTGEVTVKQLPHAHGDHMHIGPFVVSTQDASGFSNPAVWVALERKGMARETNEGITLTPEGIDYDTGLGDRFIAPSDH